MLSSVENSENPNLEILRSGSCLTFVLILDDQCYVANVGDSRAIMSVNRGNEVYYLSKDHKPSDPDEINRIAKAGGDVYVSTIK